MWLRQKRPSDIVRLLGQSRKWFYKWLHRYQESGWEGLHSQSRQPQTAAQRYSTATRKLILQWRRRAEKRKVGLKNARVLHQEIKQSRLLPTTPSPATIHRWLKDEGLIPSATKADSQAYYPACTFPTGIVHQAMDWISRNLPGGKEEIVAFHTLDLHTRGLTQTLCTDKTGESVQSHAMTVWQTLGLPDVLQLDNDGAFNGGGRTPRRIGAFVRLCLWYGIELLFTPQREPQHNGDIERLNGLWVTSFWKRNYFRTVKDVRQKQPRFLTWYHTQYHPPSLNGRTVAATLRGQPRWRLTAKQARELPSGKLPITAGRIHFIRRVSASGEIKLLKENWKVGRRLRGRYVWATVTTDKQTLEIYYRASERTEARLIRTFDYSLPEKIVPLQKEYRHRARRFPVPELL